MESTFDSVCESYFACSTEPLSRLLKPAPNHVTPKARLFAYLKNKSFQAEFNSSRTKCYDDATFLDGQKQIMYGSPHVYQDQLSPIHGDTSAYRGSIANLSFKRGEFFEPRVLNESSQLSNNISFFALGQGSRQQDVSQTTSSPQPIISSLLESLESRNPHITKKAKASSSALRSPLLLDVCNQTEETFSHCKKKQKNETAKQENELENWSITLSRDGLIRLNGFVNGRKYYRRTKAVVKRHGKRLVQTSSGSRYKLIGLRQTNRDEAATFYEPFMAQFNNGFPWNWREVLLVVKTEMQSSDEKHDETMANKTDVKVPAVNDDTLTQGKRRKSAPVKTEPIQEEELHRSKRSGRIVYPPLAFWANQRVIVKRTCEGVSNVHVQGNKNELSCRVLVSFQSTEQKKKRSKTVGHHSSHMKDLDENTEVYRKSNRHRKAQEV